MRQRHYLSLQELVILFEFVHAVILMTTQMVHHDDQLKLTVLQVPVAFLPVFYPLDLHDVLDRQLRVVVLHAFGVILPRD